MFNKNFLIAKYKTDNDFITNINPFGKNKGAFDKELEWRNEFGSTNWKYIGDGLWKLIK